MQGAEGAPCDTLLIRILLALHLLDFSSLCIDLESVLLDGELHVEEVMAGHEVEVIDLAEGKQGSKGTLDMPARPIHHWQCLWRRPGMRSPSYRAS